MQDSKREEFKNRLVQLCVMAVINGTEKVVIDLQSLLNLYDSEISKAREEGIREGLEDILSEVENWKTHYLDTTKSEPSKTMQIGLVNVIRKMLSKLTTK